MSDVAEQILHLDDNMINIRRNDVDFSQSTHVVYDMHSTVIVI